MRRGALLLVRQKLFLGLLVASLILALGSWQVRPAFAAALTSASDTLSTMKQSVAANHTIQMTTPTGVAAAGTITVTFPTGFNLSTVVFGDMDLQTGASCGALSDQTLAASPSGATWGAAVASQVVTFTSGSGTVAAGGCINIKIGTNATFGGTGTHQITNQTAAQNVTNQKITLTAGASDTGTIAVEIIADNTVAVTATVDPTITCTISANSAAFGTFTVNTVTAAGTAPVWTVSTNATHGYSLSVQSAGNGTNAGLYSLGAGYVIKSADSAENSTADLSVSGTIGYGLQGTKTDGDSGSAVTSVSSPYTSTSNTVGRLQLTAQTLASATGPVSNATITSTLKAKVTGLVPSGSYTDTLTYVCTGTF